MKIQIKKWQREGEKKTPNQKGTSDSSHVPTSDPCRFRTVQKEKKKKEQNKTTQKQPPSRPLSSRLDTARCLLFMFSVRSHSQWHSLQGVQTINCTWQEVKLYIYIYKKTKNIKQCENSDHLKINKKKRTFESSYYYYFCYHTESAISHQQWFQLTVPIAAQCHNTI